jgi:hypothetical protein
VTQQPGIGAQHVLPARRLRGGGGAAFIQAQTDGRRNGDAHRHERIEHGMPAGSSRDPAANGGRQQRRDRQHQHQQAKDAGGIAVVIAIAHDGAAGDHGCTTAQRLEKAPDHQRLDRGCQRAEQAGRHIDRATDQYGRPPPDPITERPEEQLPQRHADEERGQRQLHRRRRGAVIAGDGRQRGQIEIDGDGAKGRQRPQQQDLAQMGLAN